jgi:hypothetical protein
MTRFIRSKRVSVVVVAVAAVSTLGHGSVFAEDKPAAATTQSLVTVVDGVVQPRRPLAEAIRDAIAFLKKGDGSYVPGKVDVAKAGEDQLAGYFTSAHVLEDGTRSDRRLAFPGRQHAYFIYTFLHFREYSHEDEWLVRARDLADWNLAHSTPADAAWPNLPWSAWQDGKPGGSNDKESLEPDKAAFLGRAYLELYDAAKDQKYLDGAKKIADTLVRRQRADGSWPFRVIPGDGKVFQDVGGAPVFFVEFFETLLKHDDVPGYRKAHDNALRLMLARNVERSDWGTYHEDIKDKPTTHLSAEPMSFTARYLFRHGKQHPEYVAMGRKIIALMDEKLVHTDGHPAAPAPAVSEQSTFQHMMPGHTARYCSALAELYAATGDEGVKRKATSGINALTYMQSPEGLFKTFFQKVNERNPGKRRLDWYSQHLYTVCHVLEAAPLLPDIKLQPRPAQASR